MTYLFLRKTVSTPRQEKVHNYDSRARPISAKNRRWRASLWKLGGLTLRKKLKTVFIGGTQKKAVGLKIFMVKGFHFSLDGVFDVSRHPILFLSAFYWPEETPF